MCTKDFCCSGRRLSERWIQKPFQQFCANCLECFSRPMSGLERVSALGLFRFLTLAWCLPSLFIGLLTIKVQLMFPKYIAPVLELVLLYVFAVRALTSHVGHTRGDVQPHEVSELYRRILPFIKKQLGMIYLRTMSTHEWNAVAQTQEVIMVKYNCCPRFVNLLVAGASQGSCRRHGASVFVKSFTCGRISCILQPQ